MLKIDSATDDGDIDAHDNDFGHEAQSLERPRYHAG